MLIDPLHLKTIFSQQGLLNDTIESALADYANKQQLTFTKKDFSTLILSDWAVDKKSKAHTKGLHMDSLMLLGVRHKDPSHPFTISLTLKKARGAPAILVQVYNNYLAEYDQLFCEEILLKTKTKKPTVYDELSYYWQSGKILQAIVQPELADVSYAAAAQTIKGLTLTDVNGQPIKGYKADAIAYLYEKIKAKKAHLLHDEPIEWDIPSSVKSSFSSGFVDSLQEAMQVNVHSSQPKYRQFLAQYPTIHDFAKKFDVRYH